MTLDRPVNRIGVVALCLGMAFSVCHVPELRPSPRACATAMASRDEDDSDDDRWPFGA